MASAPKISETRLMYGVPGKNWQIAAGQHADDRAFAELGPDQEDRQAVHGDDEFGFMTVK